MKSKILAALLALVFVCSVSALRAEDATPKKASPAEDTSKVYSVKCDAPCDFMVSGHDKAEVAEIARKHAKTHHNMKMTKEEAEKMVTVSDAKP